MHNTEQKNANVCGAATAVKPKQKQCANWPANYRDHGTATAATTTASVQRHRHRKNDTATAAIARPSLMSWAKTAN